MNPWLPAGVDAVLARGLAKSAPARYESCAAFVDALERACRPVEEPQPARQAPPQPPSPQVPLKSAAEELPPTAWRRLPACRVPTHRDARRTPPQAPSLRCGRHFGPEDGAPGGRGGGRSGSSGLADLDKAPQRAQLRVRVGQSETIPPAGRQVKVPVTTAAGCPWTAATDAPWLSITSAAGKGNGDLVYTVARNESPAPRTGTIVIGGQTHRVTQAGALPRPIAATSSTRRPCLRGPRRRPGA